MESPKASPRVGTLQAMTDAVGEHEHESTWTDDSWREWNDYADNVTVQVRFKAEAGAEDADEFWLIESDGAAWSRDWLTREVVELTAVDAHGGCCGGGSYLLEIRDQRTEWGASAAVVDVLLTLAQDQLSNLTWAAMGALAHRMATRQKEKHPDWMDADVLSDDHVRESALWAVVRFRGLYRGDLSVRSVEALDGGGAVVEVQDVRGTLFMVRVESRSGGVLLARVRKVTEP